jgi:hypothetical protein
MYSTHNNLGKTPITTKITYVKPKTKRENHKKLTLSLVWFYRLMIQNSVLEGQSSLTIFI